MPSDWHKAQKLRRKGSEKVSNICPTNSGADGCDFYIMHGNRVMLYNSYTFLKGASNCTNFAIDNIFL